MLNKKIRKEVKILVGDILNNHHKWKMNNEYTFERGSDICIWVANGACCIDFYPEKLKLFNDNEKDYIYQSIQKALMRQKLSVISKDFKKPIGTKPSVWSFKNAVKKIRVWNNDE